MTTKSKPLRVRVTPDDLKRYEEAMARLGLQQLSSYVRWALENATKMVMSNPVQAPVNALSRFAAPAGPPLQVPMPRRRRAARTTPAPVLCEGCEGLSEAHTCEGWTPPPEVQAAVVTMPAISQGRLPSVAEAFGVPLAGGLTRGPMPAPIVDDDDWA